MKFDTVIIGGGLSGLLSGIRLTQQGLRCVIISSGQSALHFSSGSFDLLNNLADGTPVKNPASSIKELQKISPEHPYAKLGETKFAEMATYSEKFLSEIGVELTGSSKENHYRITPIGVIKPTWLSMKNFAVSENEGKFPWKKIAILNVDGFLDFEPDFVADSFQKIGIKTDIKYFNLPELDVLRRNPSEFRSINLGRVLDDKNNREKLVKIFKDNSEGSEAVIFPACIGLEDKNIVSDMSGKIGKPIYLLPTMPPSLVGIRTQLYLRDYFEKIGGTYMLGDNVIKADIEDNKVKKIYTLNHGDIPFSANNVILASGSFFSQGLIATMSKVYEPVFDLDVDYKKDRADWYNINLFKKQAYQAFGVKTNSTFNALKNNTPIENLYVSGAILNGFNPIKEGCGGGVSILTALYVSEQILTKEKSYELAK